VSREDILSQPPPSADLRIPYGKDPSQFFDLRLPGANLSHAAAGEGTKTEVILSKREHQRARVEGSEFAPLAIVIHGGFWRAKYDLTHAGHLCAALTQAGIATLNVEYRRVGNPGGGWPGSLQDIESVFKVLPTLSNKHAVDPLRVVVIGHSAGGHLALALAARQSSLRGVVALAPVSDLHRAYDLHLSNDAVVEFLGGTPAAVPKLYAEASPIELPISVPQVIIHGTRDDTVPIDMSRSYVERKRQHNEHVRLIEPDCGHFELIDPSSQVWRLVQQAAQDLLKP
jgi:acetyl esterase/lipase